MSDLEIKGLDGALSQPAEVERPGAKTDGGAFTETLKEALQEVNDLQNRSAEQVGEVLNGELKDVHSAMLALQKADLSFQLMLQVRNKLVQAYRDIMRMP